ncbi:MAG: cytochrome P460 family protein [Rhizobacter sp.]|nr:cytochrome P460 family protein [Bacteriovorax sp.]
MKIIFFISFFYSALSLAEAIVPKKEMNEIKYSDYKNFDKKWKLVTVRFRQDTEEMRFTYANPLAFKTLKNGMTDYPDGAVFGKVGLMTGADPLFESSLVPMGARRYQLMVRNKNKYKEQNGWGYALFDERGFPFPEDHKTQVVACAACHVVAEERGYVFSQIADMNLRVKHDEGVLKDQKNKKKIIFTMVPRSELAENILKVIPEKFKFIRVLSGEMASNLFQGTLEEIRPTLSQEVFQSKRPALLKSLDSLRFSLVFPENLGSLCNKNEKSGMYMKSIYTNLSTEKNLTELSFCMTP